jgi:hypothetical protein
MHVLYWLVMLLVPVLGLTLGTWLTPAPQILWEKMANGKTLRVLGYADNGNILLRLLADRDQSDSSILRNMVVEGLDPRTGETRFTHPAPPELMCSWSREGFPQLVDDGVAILFMLHQDTDNPNRLVVYDWRKQQVLRRYQTTAYHLLQRVTYRKGTLAAYVSGKGADPTKEYLLYWHGNAVEPVEQEQAAFYASISEDGQRIAIHATADWQLNIIDAPSQKLIQKVAGDHVGIHWMNGHQEYLAVTQTRNRSGSTFAQRFVQKNGQYVPESALLTVLPTPGELKFSPPYLLARTNTRFELWRKDLHDYVGDSFNSLIHLWWPEGSIRQMHDLRTGELLYRAIFPDAFSRIRNLADPLQPALVFYDEENMTVWQYPTRGQYYPWIGLGLGLSCSMMLLYRWIKQRKAAYKEKPFIYLRRNRPVESSASEESSQAAVSR